MTAGPDACTLAWLFVHPVTMPDSARLWMLFPLVACVALVYRATRVRRVAEMARAALFTFVNIIVGMTIIALAFYLVHFLVRELL